MRQFNEQIAVLTVSYNHEKWIGQCIESVMEQRCNMPIVHYIWDDKSSDGTFDIIQQYKEKNPKRIISYRQEENRGALNNYLDALEKILSDSRNKYIALLDGDDYWCDNNHIDEKCNYMNQHDKCGIVHSNIYILYDDMHLIKCSERINSMPQGNIFDQMLSRPLFSALSVVMRTSLLYDFPINELRNLPLQTVDHVLELWVCSKSESKYFEKAIGVWRRHKNTISTSQNLNGKLRWLEHECAQHKWIINHFPDCPITKVDLEYHRDNVLFEAYFSAGKYEEARNILDNNAHAGEYAPKYASIIKKGKIIYYLYFFAKKMKKCIVVVPSKFMKTGCNSLFPVF